MRPREALELCIVLAADGDVLAVRDGVVHRAADQDLTAIGRAGPAASTASRHSTICVPVTGPVLDACGVTVAKAPYYEGRFLRANDPDGARAVWLRETLRCRRWANRRPTCG